MLRERTEVLLVSNEPFHQLHVGRIIDFLAKNRRARRQRPSCCRAAKKEDDIAPSHGAP
jgi:hypothetical protein